MNRLKKFIIIFCLALAVPLGYFIVGTRDGLRQEEMGELRFFTETLLDQMEEDLDGLVRREESRAIDEYSYYLSDASEQTGSADNAPRSPLSEVPKQSYIMGYLQIAPDGSLQTPLLRDQDIVPPELESLVSGLRELAASFQSKKAVDGVREPAPTTVSPVAEKQDSEEYKEYGIGARYLKTEQYSKKKSSLGREEKRIEKISAAQVQNITQQAYIPQQQAMPSQGVAPSDDFAEGVRSTDEVWESEELAVKSLSDTSGDTPPSRRDISSLFEGRREVGSGEKEAADKNLVPRPAMGSQLVGEADDGQWLDTYKVEVDPLQSVAVDSAHVFVFRRIVLDDHIYRQGLVLNTSEFLSYLGANYFSGQPLARFARLRLSAAGPEGVGSVATFGVPGKGAKPVFHLQRVFPRPFSFLSAGISCEEVPQSAGRRTVGIMMGILVGVVLLGLLAIYRSAWVVNEMSRRRTGFVSSVTHELKTPLTNIRMYIEMLEHGIAGSKEREAEYFRILRTESERLTRLINNVLEFSKLEKK